MDLWHTLFGGLAVVAGLGSLYGLHRLALWLEEHGYLYYIHKKPKGGSAAGCFVAFQRAIEPQSEHVLLVHEEAPCDDAESAGWDHPPGSCRDKPVPPGGRDSASIP